MKWTPGKLKHLLNLYPPYLGAAVRVTFVAPDWRELHVSMKRRWWNRNAVGAHFGGSLYSMVDPHLMLMLMQILGPDYVVWDKSASIDFKKPGRGTVHAVIKVSDSGIDQIRRETAGGKPYYGTYEKNVLDEQGDLVTRVTQTIYVRLRTSPGG